MEELKKFLNVRRLTESSKEPMTHIMMESPKGKYAIEDCDKNRLYKLLTDMNRKGKTLSLLECQTTTYIPVIFDIDLNSPVEKKLYEKTQVQNMIRCIQNALKTVVEDMNEEKLGAFFLEKEKPYYCERTDRFKNGFHLHFPKIFLTRMQQEKNLLPHVLDELELLWKKDSTSLPGPPKEIIDNSIYRGKGKCWFLLGSGKKKMPYRLAAFYDHDGQEQPLDNHLPVDEKDRLKMFSVQMDDEKKKYVSSIHPEIDSFETSIPQPLEFAQIVENASTVDYVAKKMQEPVNEDIDNWVDEILDMLDESHAKDRDKWMYIGWILYNIYRGKSDGFDRWNIFSQKCKQKYNAKVCEEEWKKMEIKNMSLGSLKHLARESNPSEYALLIKKFAKKYTSKCTESAMTHYDIAKMLHNIYEDSFVCANVAKNVWYEFSDGIWKQCDDGVSLRNKISTTIVEQILEIKDNVYVEAKANMGQSTKFKSEDMEKLKSVDFLIKQLKMTPFKKNVMCEAKDLFYDGKFLKRLDANENLFAFQNGVLKIGFDKENQKNTFEFQKSAPEHYLSLRSPVSYNPNLNMEHPKVKAVLDFFEKIFPNERIRKYFLELNSYIFRGGNSQKKVQVWTGVGDNGKSITEKLIEKMLGPYCVKLPTSLITGNRTQSGAANPELARAGSGQRFAFLQETSKKEFINVGILKELSGNDTFYARNLFKEGQDMTPMFKLCLVANEPPKVDGAQTDQATWNRIRVIPFESKFVENAPESKVEQIEKKLFPIDRQFDEKIPDLLEGLVFLLLHEFTKAGKQIYEPQEVTCATQIYKNKNDYYGIFINERIGDDENECLTMNELYIAFKEWFKESNENSAMPSKQDVKEYFTKYWGKPQSGMKWVGKAILCDTDLMDP